MRRPLAWVLLLFSFVWQATVMACQVPMLASNEEMEHATLHWQEVGHHHLDDGSLQVADWSESTTHSWRTVSQAPPPSGSTQCFGSRCSNPSHHG